MSPKLAERLDLERAWRLAKCDIRGDLRGRNFVSHPFEIDVVDASLEEWLERIRGKVANGYNPSPCEVFDYPKPGFQVRPASRLDLPDAVVYFALGQHVVDAVHESLTGLVNIDYSYVLKRRPASEPWFKSVSVAGKTFTTCR